MLVGIDGSIVDITFFIDVTTESPFPKQVIKTHPLGVILCVVDKVIVEDVAAMWKIEPE